MPIAARTKFVAFSFVQHAQSPPDRELRIFNTPSILEASLG